MLCSCQRGRTDLLGSLFRSNPLSVKQEPARGGGGHEGSSIRCPEGARKRGPGGGVSCCCNSSSGGAGSAARLAAGLCATCILACLPGVTSRAPLAGERVPFAAFMDAVACY